MSRPAVYERGRAAREADARVRVADAEGRPGDRLALRGEQLEAPVGGLREAEDRDRPEAHLHLDGEPGSRLAVEQLERAQHGPAVRDRDVPWSVVPHEHEFLVEVERVELRVG